MIAQGLLTFTEVENLERYVGTSKCFIILNIYMGGIDLFFKAFSQFGDGYNTSRKEPDMCIRPVDMALPSIVLESGWSETRQQLYRDRDPWLHGGSGLVQLVIVIKWTNNAVIFLPFEAFFAPTPAYCILCPPPPCSMVQRLGMSAIRNQADMQPAAQWSVPTTVGMWTLDKTLAVETHGIPPIWQTLNPLSQSHVFDAEAAAVGTWRGLDCTLAELPSAPIWLFLDITFTIWGLQEVAPATSQ